MLFWRFKVLVVFWIRTPRIHEYFSLWSKVNFNLTISWSTFNIMFKSRWCISNIISNLSLPLCHRKVIITYRHWWQRNTMSNSLFGMSCYYQVRSPKRLLVLSKLQFSRLEHKLETGIFEDWNIVWRRTNSFPNGIFFAISAKLIDSLSKFDITILMY